MICPLSDLSITKNSVIPIYIANKKYRMLFQCQIKGVNVKGY